MEQEETLSKRPVDMQQLLKWSIAIQELGGKEDHTEQPVEREPLDPKWVDIILGKPDFVRMKDCLTVLQKDSSEDDKMEAADELEMLIETVDNARDFVKAGLLRSLLDMYPKSSPKIKEMILWILGTMCQNDEVIKRVYLNDGVLPVVLVYDVFLNKKLLYFLASFLSNNLHGTQLFCMLKGNELLNRICQAQPDLTDRVEHVQSIQVPCPENDQLNE